MAYIDNVLLEVTVGAFFAAGHLQGVSMLREDPKLSHILL